VLLAEHIEVLRGLATKDAPHTRYLLEPLLSFSEDVPQVLVPRTQMHRGGQAEERPPGMRVVHQRLDLLEVLDTELEKHFRPLFFAVR